MSANVRDLPHPPPSLTNPGIVGKYAPEGSSVCRPCQPLTNQSAESQNSSADSAFYGVDGDEDPATPCARCVAGKQPHVAGGLRVGCDRCVEVRALYSSKLTVNQLSPRTMPSLHSVSHTASHTASGTILRGVVVVCKSTSPRAGWALERRQRLQARPAPNMPPAQGSAHS